jgi:hypothetical protein
MCEAAAMRRCGVALSSLCIPVPPSPRDKKVAVGGWLGGREGGDHVIEQSLSCIVNNDASGMIDCPNAHKMSARCLLKIDDVRRALLSGARRRSAGDDGNKILLLPLRADEREKWIDTPRINHRSFLVIDARRCR